MYAKEAFIVLSFCAANLLGITVDSQFVFPVDADNFPDDINASTRKILTKRPPKLSLAGNEDETNLKYFLVFRPSTHNFYPESKPASSDENNSKTKLRNANHVRKVPQNYLPRFPTETSQSHITRQHTGITIPTNHSNAFTYKQSGRDQRPEIQLPKSIVTSNLERIIRKGPEVQGNDDRDSRIIYQAHGFAGPTTYKFGYDTGRGKDRHFHDEERLASGHVKGHYGYVNPTGKTTVVRYAATPETGFRIEKIV